MEIGDYIRYKEEGVQKIGRIEKISATLADDALIIEVDNGDVITNDDVLKSDKSIIHEIEVGDYVNGWRVNWVKKEEDGIFLKVGTITSFVSKNETDPYLTQDYDEADKMCKLKSIVTKQQFEAMQYVIKED